MRKVAIVSNNIKDSIIKNIIENPKAKFKAVYILDFVGSLKYMELSEEEFKKVIEALVMNLPANVMYLLEIIFRYYKIPNIEDIINNLTYKKLDEDKVLNEYLNALIYNAYMDFVNGVDSLPFKDERMNQRYFILKVTSVVLKKSMPELLKTILKNGKED